MKTKQTTLRLMILASMQSTLEEYQITMLIEEALQKRKQKEEAQDGAKDSSNDGS